MIVLSGMLGDKNNCMSIVKILGGLGILFINSINSGTDNFTFSPQVEVYEQFGVVHVNLLGKLFGKLFISYISFYILDTIADIAQM